MELAGPPLGVLGGPRPRVLPRRRARAGLDDRPVEAGDPEPRRHEARDVRPPARRGGGGARPHVAHEPGLRRRRLLRDVARRHRRRLDRGRREGLGPGGPADPRRGGRRPVHRLRRRARPHDGRGHRQQRPPPRRTSSPRSRPPRLADRPVVGGRPDPRAAAAIAPWALVARAPASTVRLRLDGRRRPRARVREAPSPRLRGHPEPSMPSSRARRWGRWAAVALVSSLLPACGGGGGGGGGGGRSGLARHADARGGHDRRHRRRGHRLRRGDRAFPRRVLRRGREPRCRGHPRRGHRERDDVPVGGRLRRALRRRPLVGVGEGLRHQPGRVVRVRVRADRRPCGRGRPVLGEHHVRRRRGERDDGDRRRRRRRVRRRVRAGRRPLVRLRRHVVGLGLRRGPVGPGVRGLLPHGRLRGHARPPRRDVDPRPRRSRARGPSTTSTSRRGMPTSSSSASGR